MATIKQIKDTAGNVHNIVDTKNTTGSTNKSDTKLFLVGASSQAANPVTYSNSNVYIASDNYLETNVGIRISTGTTINAVGQLATVTVDASAISGIDITGTNISGTNISGTDISSTNITASKISCTNTLTTKVLSVTSIAQIPNLTTTNLTTTGTITAGFIKVPAGTITVGGDVTATAFYQSSDERLKTFTEDYDIDLDNIKQIRTGRFHWNEDKNKTINGGVTAQTVEQYFPELVREDENGIKSVNYDGLAVVAIAAIKKLTERVEELEKIVHNK